MKNGSFKTIKAIIATALLISSAAIALTAYRAGVPALLIKTVSDAVTGGAEEFLAACRRTASICMEMALKLAKEV